MGNVFRILLRDFKRLLKAPAALVVVAALLVLPSLYTWYNVIAFWNPYNETGNLRVCVVNQDAGTTTNLTGELDVGDKLVEELLANDQLAWEEHDYDTAMELLKTGEIYAVYMIPEDFSACLVSPLTGEVKSPHLEYFANEKLGPVSPKITDTAASALEEKINAAFVATVAEAATEAVDEAVGDAQGDVASAKDTIAARMDEADAAISGIRDDLADLQGTADNARAAVADASGAVSGASSLFSDAKVVIIDVENEAMAFRDALAALAQKISPGQFGLPEKLEEAVEEASAVADGLAKVTAEAQSDIEMVVARLQPVVDALQDAASRLKEIADNYPKPGLIKDALEKAAQDAQERADEAQVLLDILSDVADKLGRISEKAEQTSKELDELSGSVPDAVIQFEEFLEGVAATAVDSETAQIIAACETLSAEISTLEASVGQVSPIIDQLDGVLAGFSDAVGQTNTLVGNIQGDFKTLATDAGIVLSSNTLSEILGDGTLNAQKISEFMGAPTQLSTTGFFPMNAYGSSMAPLFMNLTFWIGAFMLVIIFRLEVDEEGIKGTKPWQRYLGRFIMFAIFAVLQSAICCAGTLALGVQAAAVPALFLGSAVASLAYLSLIYALSVLFRHVGKALCIVLVFAQIPAGSGLYPVELTSSFFQSIYPFLPFSYGINAVREGIGGLYGDHFVHDIAVLGLLLVGCVIVGMLVAPLMSNVVRMTASHIRAGDLYNGEEVLTAERPYRLTQVLRALTEKETYREEIEKRYARFSRLYPIFIRVSIIAGVGIPMLLGLLLALDTGEKVTLLVLFLVWLVALIAFLVIVESRRSSFERQLNLESMSDERLLNLYTERNRAIRSSWRPPARAKDGEEPQSDCSSEQDDEPRTQVGGRIGDGLYNIGFIIRHDVSALFKNTMSAVITVGLIVLPSLFAWGNILACWDVFDNTGNLSIAMANEDAGYESDLLPLDVNIGEKVVSALHENDQIGWVFTDADDAIEGTKSGKYYAALVIPEGFSKDMLTFFDGNGLSATIDYYVNEKKNAIAPNITGIGADTVSAEVNAAFAKTLSEVAAGLAQSLMKILDDTDAAGLVASLTDGTRTVADRVDQSADVLGLYSLVSKQSQSLLQSSADALDAVWSKIEVAISKIDAAKQLLRELVAALSDTVKDIEAALDDVKIVVDELEKKADELIDSAEADVAALADKLRDEADDIDAKAKDIRALVKELKKLRDDLQSGIETEIEAAYSSGRTGGGLTVKPDKNVEVKLSSDTVVMIEDTFVLDEIIAVLTKAADALDDASAACRKTADAIDKGSKDVRTRLDNLKKLAKQVRTELESSKEEFEQMLSPSVDRLKADIETLAADLDRETARLEAIGASLPGAVRTVAGAFGDISGKIDAADGKLRTTAQRLRSLADAIDTALLSGDMDTVASLLKGDPAELAAALSTPVQVNRTALFPCANFGSAMTPMYCTLAMFIGSLLIMVAMSVEVSRRIRERLRNPKPRHLYFGRFGVVALLSLAQTTLLALGCMLFLKVQVVDPLLFMIGFWISGLVFAFIIYTLVVAFGNLGKALSVLLLIVQVTACGGSYPLSILPDFVQAISPWVPATYIVDALRAAMMGVYMNDFWVAIGHLLLFVIPFLLLGLVLRKPLERFMKFYVSKVEECKIME